MRRLLEEDFKPAVVVPRQRGHNTFLANLAPIILVEKELFPAMQAFYYIFAMFRGPSPLAWRTLSTDSRIGRWTLSVGR
jgi:hypothetical protein